MEGFGKVASLSLNSPPSLARSEKEKCDFNHSFTFVFTIGLTWRLTAQ